jgi:hypothetical protein
MYFKLYIYRDCEKGFNQCTDEEALNAEEFREAESAEELCNELNLEHENYHPLLKWWRFYDCKVVENNVPKVNKSILTVDELKDISKYSPHMPSHRFKIVKNEVPISFKVLKENSVYKIHEEGFYTKRVRYFDNYGCLKCDSEGYEAALKSISISENRLNKKKLKEEQEFNALPDFIKNNKELYKLYFKSLLCEIFSAWAVNLNNGKLYMSSVWYSFVDNSFVGLKNFKYMKEVLKPKIYKKGLSDARLPLRILSYKLNNYKGKKLEEFLDGESLLGIRKASHVITRCNELIEECNSHFKRTPIEKINIEVNVDAIS